MTAFNLRLALLPVFFLTFNRGIAQIAGPQAPDSLITRHGTALTGRLINVSKLQVAMTCRLAKTDVWRTLSANGEVTHEAESYQPPPYVGMHVNAPEDALVAFDGDPVGRGPCYIRCMAGRHVLAARLPGGDAAETRFVAEAYENFVRTVSYSRYGRELVPRMEERHGPAVYLRDGSLFVCTELTVEDVDILMNFSLPAARIYKAVAAEHGVMLQNDANRPQPGGMVHVETDPQAWVLVDAVPHGRGNVSWRQPPGPVCIEARRRGYGQDRCEVTIVPGEDVRVALKLQPQLCALTLNMPQKDAEGSSLFVDGIREDLVPGMPLTLLEGNYSIRVEKKRHVPFVRELTLAKDEARTVDVKLQSFEGALKKQSRLKLNSKLSALATAAVCGAGFLMKSMADAKYDDYLETQSTRKALEFKDQVKLLDNLSLAAFIGSGILAGVTLYQFDAQRDHARQLRAWGVTVSPVSIEFRLQERP